MDVAVPEQIVSGEGVAVAIGVELIVTVVVALSAEQPPLATIIFLIVYVPGSVVNRSISPVFVFAKNKPAGVEENVPANAPGTKVGTGLLPN
jgi:hypothetical protein